MKQLNMDLQAAGEKRCLQINEMDEFRNEAYENPRIYKERTKAWHDKHISKKEFLPGQQESSNLYGQAHSQLLKFFPHRAVKITHDEKGTFKVNGQRLKPYLSGEFDNKKTTFLLDPA
ncbi:uncharacterized protein LOC111391645 [Olea europaea var. sylvestris]|uniref:uncharacterized protein LOC111391645 n=1 Tax=Olea europaea var. sylvestris TaxID=158386 RepID=UPI000C1D0B70|nr:uncharacterized protein LOC111391645 [Olea europaea var. sylvestris]